jgi:hypothetical protein
MRNLVFWGQSPGKEKVSAPLRVAAVSGDFERKRWRLFLRVNAAFSLILIVASMTCPRLHQRRTLADEAKEKRVNESCLP